VPVPTVNANAARGARSKFRMVVSFYWGERNETHTATTA
jgi:hypothetical protein